MRVTSRYGRELALQGECVIGKSRVLRESSSKGQHLGRFANNTGNQQPFVTRSKMRRKWCRESSEGTEIRGERERERDR